jgi:hypothetical protein
MLYAYTSFALGGVTWLLPVLILFLSYAIVWPQSSRREHDPHTSRSVMAVVSAGLAWLFLGHALDEYSLILPYSMSFAFHLTFIGIAWERSQPDRVIDIRRLSIAAMQGWAIIMLPYFALHFGIFPLSAIPLTVICSLLAAWCYGSLIPASAGAQFEECPWLRQALIAAIFSLPGVLMI